MGEDPRPRNPDIERFLVTIEESPVWRDDKGGIVGDAPAGPVEYHVATSGGRDKAVALAVEEFHRLGNNGGPRRTIRTIHADPAPGPFDDSTLQDMDLDG